MTLSTSSMTPSSPDYARTHARSHARDHHACANPILTPRFYFSGSSYSYGVIQAKLEQQGVGSSSTLAFVGSMSSAALSIFAIPNAALIRKYGARKVLIAGGLITGLGEIIASWAVHSIPGLFISYGLFTGVGYSMIYLVSRAWLHGSHCARASRRVVGPVYPLNGPTRQPPGCPTHSHPAVQRPPGAILCPQARSRLWTRAVRGRARGRDHRHHPQLSPRERRPSLVFPYPRSSDHHLRRPRRVYRQRTSRTQDAHRDRVVSRLYLPSHRT
jgi:hypothetical protein